MSTPVSRERDLGEILAEAAARKDRNRHEWADKVVELELYEIAVAERELRGRNYGAGQQRHKLIRLRRERDSLRYLALIDNTEAELDAELAAGREFVGLDRQEVTS